MSLDLFIGTDESNNGRPFEVHTAIFSLLPTDVLHSKTILPKIRHHKNLFNKLKKRAYSYLLFTDFDKSRIPRQERAGVILSSLIDGQFEWGELNSVNILLDGNRSKYEMDTVLNMVSDRINTTKLKIDAKYGAQFDQKYYIVNLADQLAHYLFKKGVDFISAEEHSRPLRY